MNVSIKNSGFLICYLLCCFCNATESNSDRPDADQSTLLTQDTLVQQETNSPIIFNKTPVIKEDNTATLSSSSNCFFKGTVYHQYGPSTFNTIWITGAGKKNKGTAQKVSTDNKGVFRISLKPGNYNIEVYGPDGVVAEVQYDLNCSKVVLPTIHYKKNGS